LLPPPPTSTPFPYTTLFRSHRERRGPLPPPAVGAADNETSRDENDGFNAAMSETHIFGSTLVNESRFGFNSLTTDKRPLTDGFPDRKSTRLNSSHVAISYAV